MLLFDQINVYKLLDFKRGMANGVEERGNELNSVNVSQEKIHDLVFSREIGWQEIIYDLINSEQLDPWNINIVILTNKYLDKIQELQEADFLISSKVLLAASLLLRIKTEMLLNKYIKSVDEILFGKKEQKKYVLERIELTEEIPNLMPRSPIPRFKKVSLQELIDSLSKAITTENRRINKAIIQKNALRETSFSLPKTKYHLKDKIREMYLRLVGHFQEKKGDKKVPFSPIFGRTRDEQVMCFSPLLHLEAQQRVWLEQSGHFEEIYIWMRKEYLKHNPDPLADLRKELEELNKSGNPKEKIAEMMNSDFENPVNEKFEEQLYDDSEAFPEEIKD